MEFVDIKRDANGNEPEPGWGGKPGIEIGRGRKWVVQEGYQVEAGRQWAAMYARWDEKHAKDVDAWREGSDQGASGAPLAKTAVVADRGVTVSPADTEVARGAAAGKTRRRHSGEWDTAYMVNMERQARGELYTDAAASGLAVVLQHQEGWSSVGHYGDCAGPMGCACCRHKAGASCGFCPVCDSEAVAVNM